MPRLEGAAATVASRGGGRARGAATGTAITEGHAAAHGLAGGETMTSAQDDDPAIEFDAGARTVHIHDDASATAPAFDLRGTLTPL